MAGKIIYTPPPRLCGADLCEGRPDPTALTRGTLWMCDICEKVYVVVEGAQYNESYSAWRILTEANREGYDRF